MASFSSSGDNSLAVNPTGNTASGNPVPDFPSVTSPQFERIMGAAEDAIFANEAMGGKVSKFVPKLIARFLKYGSLARGVESNPALPPAADFPPMWAVDP